MHAAHPLILTHRFWLVAIALAIVGVVFAPWYLLSAAVRLAPAMFDSVPAWYRFFYLFNLLRAVSFSRVEIYLLVSLLGIAGVLAAWLWSRPSHVVRALLLVSLLAILAFPIFYRYQPALVAAPGYSMRFATQPGLLDGVVKRNQVTTETRPCEYALLGWTKEAELYYQAQCADAPMQMWAIAPDRETSARSVASAPLELYVERAPVSVSERVRAAGVWPASEESNARRVYLREGSLISQDGYWVALIARHLYGPEDVILVSAAR